MTKDIDKKLTQLIDELKADTLRDAPVSRKKDTGVSEEIESKLTDLLTDLERKGKGRSPHPGSPGGQEFLPEFGRYVLIEKLGYGGMAETFKAKRADTQDGRLCVLKRIRLQFKKENTMAVFLEEAKLLARLTHPNIVPMLDFGKLNEYGYLVFDYIDGIDTGAIQNVIKARRSPIPFSALAFIGIQICRALESAYATPGPGGVPLGVIHGNIAPSNILITSHGDVLLTDFSLFRTALRLYQAVPASYRSKIAYLSPQQARGEPVDTRTDIYAIGSVMFEMVTGQPIFPRTLDPAVFHKILLGQVVPVIPRIFDAPDVLRKIILKALEFEPLKRNQKVEELREDLERYLDEDGRSLYSAADLGELMTDWFGSPGRDKIGMAGEPVRAKGKTEALRVAFPAMEVLEDERTPPLKPEPLPEPKIELDFELPIEPEPIRRPTPAPEPAPILPSQFRLLLVTPNGLTHKVVRMAFSHKNFDLSIITSGEELPAEMDRIRPDVVILDLNSPVVGAYDLCDKIKNDHRWSQTCVVLVRKEFEKIDQDRLDTINYDLMVFMPVQSREFEEKVRLILQQKGPLPGD